MEKGTDSSEATLEEVLFQAESEIQSIRKSLYNDDCQEIIAKEVGFTMTYHGKIDWDVAKRILQVIYHEGPIRRTSLAMKSELNYSAALRYLLWLQELGWIEIGKKHNRVKLSEIGMKMCERLKLDKAVGNNRLQQIRFREHQD